MSSLKESGMSSEEKQCTQASMESKSGKNKTSESKYVEQALELVKGQPKVQGRKLSKKQLLEESKVMNEKTSELHRIIGATYEATQQHLQSTRGFTAHDDPTLFNELQLNERHKMLVRSIDKITKEFQKMDTKADKTVHDRHSKSKKHSSLDLNLVKNIPDDFKILVDCKQFNSQELKVLIEKDRISVQGKHDLKLDDHGLVKREFKRWWSLPKDVIVEGFSCLLDRHGILTIRAPRQPSSIAIPVQTE